jgi:hypothetical protein
MERPQDGLAHPDREGCAGGSGQPDERTTAILSGITETAVGYLDHVVLHGQRGAEVHLDVGGIRGDRIH